MEEIFSNILQQGGLAVVAALLFFLYNDEKKERRELYTLISTLTEKSINAINLAAGSQEKATNIILQAIAEKEKPNGK